MAAFGQMGIGDLVVRADLLHSSFGRASGGLRSLSQLLQLDEQQATFEPLLFQLARPLAFRCARFEIAPSSTKGTLSVHHFC